MQDIYRIIEETKMLEMNSLIHESIEESRRLMQERLMHPETPDRDKESE